MAWYKTGTVSITNNTTTVTGTSTNFAANARVGDGFLGPDGRWYEVVNIASSTVLSIQPAYLGPNVSTGTYAIAPIQGYNKDTGDKVSAIVSQYGLTLAVLGNSGTPSGIRTQLGLGAVSTENVVPVTKGGTGATDTPNARVNLGLGSVSTENTVPVTKGGTGATNASDARANLALGSVAVENIVPVTKGGTGGNTPAAARSGLGLGIAATAAILGTMTQGGNESIFQLITNSNGKALRLPDGTMIQYGPIPNFYAIANGATAQSITLPVPFVNDQYSLSPVGAPVASNDTYGFVYSSRSNTAANLIWKNGVTAQTISSAYFMAIGRWYV